MKTVKNENVYTKHGYKDRSDYLQNLADDCGIDLSDVLMISSILGESEDFDGLTMSLDDYLDFMW